jgi:hypothetical protein
VIHSVRFEPAEPASGERLRVLVQASDPEGDAIRFTYSWRLDDRPVHGNRDQLILQGFKKHDRVEVTVNATDGVSVSERVRAETRIRNRPPVITSVRVEPSQNLVAGVDLLAAPNLRDHDGDRVTEEYEWRVNGRRQQVEGNRFSTRGLDRGDRVQVTVQASDGESSSEPMESAVLVIGNTPPRFTSAPAPPDADGVFRYLVRATDPDGDRGLVFSLAEAPEGMVIDRSGGELVWEPGEEQVGVFPVAIVVDDRKGGKARQEFELTVGEPGADAAPASPGR